MTDFAMGALVEIDSHWEGLDLAQARLDAMAAGLDDMHAPLDGIVEDIHRQTFEQFVSHGSALGHPWDPLEPSTVANKARAVNLFPDWPLVATGALMDSASGDGPFSIGETGAHEATLSLDWTRDGWNIPALHQEGVPWEIVNRKAYTTRRGHHVKATSYWWHLPARPFWEATDLDESEGADRIVAHVFSPWDN